MVTSSLGRRSRRRRPPEDEDRGLLVRLGVKPMVARSCVAVGGAAGDADDLDSAIPWEALTTSRLRLREALEEKGNARREPVSDTELGWLGTRSCRSTPLSRRESSGGEAFAGGVHWCSSGDVTPPAPAHATLGSGADAVEGHHLRRDVRASPSPALELPPSTQRSRRPRR